MKNRATQAINELNNILLDANNRFPQEIKNNVQILVQGFNELDQEVKQKDQIILQKEQLLIQKDRNLETLKESGVTSELQEFVDALHKLYPNNYPEKLEDWSSDTWGKQVIDKGEYEVIKNNLPTYRQQVLEKEFIDILHELYPSWYPVNFKDWPADSWGKEVIDGKNYKAIEGNLPIYKQWLANKKELIDILPKLHPESYPVNYEEWTNQYAKGLLDKGDYKTIEESLPFYRKQLAKKEFIEILPKLYPTNYPMGFENWSYQWGKGVVDRDEFETIKKNLPTYKKLLLKKEFIDSMHQVNPKVYPAKFEDWSNKSLGKEIVEKEDYKAMEQSLSDNRQKLKEIEKEKLLSQKESELKNLANKDQLLNDKEAELVRLKELLSLKELELANKSLIKNKVVQETEKLLAEQDIKLQKLLELNTKLDAKMQYSAKEIKIIEAEKDILSKLLIQKNEELKYLVNEKESAVNHKSFEKNALIEQLKEEIKDLNKQILEHNQHIVQSISLNEVACQPGESLLEKLISNSLNLDLSPINNHNVGNQNLAVNFDFNDIHTTHSSVILAGDLSNVEVDNSN